MKVLFTSTLSSSFTSPDSRRSSLPEHFFSLMCLIPKRPDAFFRPVGESQSPRPTCAAPIGTLQIDVVLPFSVQKLYIKDKDGPGRVEDLTATSLQTSFCPKPGSGLLDISTESGWSELIPTHVAVVLKPCSCGRPLNPVLSCAVFFQLAASCRPSQVVFLLRALE